MADFGLKCWDSQGNVTLDLTDTISRLRFYTIAGTNQSSSIVLPDIAGKSVVAITQLLAVPNATLAATTVPYGFHDHSAYVVGSKLIWEAQGIKHRPNATSAVLLFIYD